MIGRVRAQSLLCVSRRKSLPIVRPWVASFASTSDKAAEDTSVSSTLNQSTSQGFQRPGSGEPQQSPHHDFEPPAPLAGEPPGNATSGNDDAGLWTSAQAFVSDTVPPFVNDAPWNLLMGVMNGGSKVMGGIQAALQGVHSTTGMPWWATIGVMTLCVKMSLLPVLIHQQRHMDRLRAAWPEIAMLRGHLNDTLEQIPQWRIFKRYGKYRIFFSGMRGIIGMHGAHPAGLLATPLVNIPVFITFVWSIRGMLSNPKVSGLDTGGILWFTDLTVSDSTMQLPIMACCCTYLSVELGKMKNATGWIKLFQDGMQTFTILMLPWTMTFPQGVFMYWIPSAVFSSCQIVAIRQDGVRRFFGLQPVARPPPQPEGSRNLPSPASGSATN